MKTFVYSVLSLLAGYGIGYSLAYKHIPSGPSAITLYDTVVVTQVDTVTRRDTVRIRIPIPAVPQLPPADTVTIPADRLLGRNERGDSITLQAYSLVYADSMYRAVISGVSPRLDSLTIYPPHTLVTKASTTLIRPSTATSPSVSPLTSLSSVPARQSAVCAHSRLGLGIAAGITATPQGTLTPGLTLGITYRLWP